MSEELNDYITKAVAEELQTIEGRIKTFIEAITDNPDQCKARKDSISTLIWNTTNYLWDRIHEIIAKSK